MDPAAHNILVGDWNFVTEERDRLSPDFLEIRPPDAPESKELKELLDKAEEDEDEDEAYPI